MTLSTCQVSVATRFGTVQGVAVVVAIVAVIMAISQARLARDQADSARRQADAAVAQTDLQLRALRDSQQPYVWADFRLDNTQGSLMHLVVRNQGPTVARDVRIVFNPPLRGAGIEELDSVSALLAEGLQSLPPGREMRWAFAIGHKLYAEGSDLPHKYTVTIEGRGPYGDLPTLTYPLDLDEMKDVAAPRLGTLDHVTKAIDKLAQQQKR